MGIVAGDIKEITFNHPTLGTGVWSPKANEEFTFDPGGLRGDDDANLVTTNGKNIKKLNQVKWSVEGVIAWDANVEDELEKAKQLAADPVDADWTFESVNGVVWAGKGSPVGDIKGSNNGTMSIKLSGGGDLKKIVG